MRARTEKEKVEDAAHEMVEKNNLRGIQRAVEKNPWLLKTSRWGGKTLLHTACWENNATMVKHLIKLKADVNYGWYDGPPISTAIFKKASLKTINVLLQNKADLNYGGTDSGPLYWANINCSHDVVEALLKAGARRRGGEVLRSAISNGDEAYVDMLIANGISVNSKDNGDHTPVLSWAGGTGSDERHYRIAKKLLEQKADVNATDVYGQTPLF
jgi:ankyrin repeat protein